MSTRRSRGAQALVELCLALPLILLLLSIVVDLARYLHVRLVLDAVARDGVQYAAVPDPVSNRWPTESEVRSRVTTAIPSWVGPCAITCNVNASLQSEPAVEVSISVRVRAFAPVPAVLSDPFPVTAEAWYPRRR